MLDVQLFKSCSLLADTIVSQCSYAVKTGKMLVMKRRKEKRSDEDGGEIKRNQDK